MEAAAWEQLRKYDSDPDAAWEILSVKQKVKKIEPLPLDTPMQPGYTRFVCFSDTHTMHEGVDIPPGDVLINAGDFTNMGHPKDVAKFNEFLGTQPHPHKIVVAGNHDLTFDPESYQRLWKRFGHAEMFDCQATREMMTDCTLLQDSETTINGIRVYGSPWQPEFCDWAFNLPRGDQLREKWAKIPSGIDVLITHGPPIGHGDLCTGGNRAGCVDLLQTVQMIKPSYHVFGHIHEGYGVTEDGLGTTYINASSCNLQYKPINPCVIFDLPNRRLGRFGLQ
mmetsp:Transcript_3257/g.8178  ORF Transcript_3257/g.8178 Transcript_3257/m.8178 type:complete len:280 (+) Transcript_3257:152-991(+)